jgi:hypothetical protein
VHRLLLACLVLAGCAEQGSRGPLFETSRFAPQLCTRGNPGEPTCPTNIVDLTNFGVPDARFILVVRVVSTGLEVAGLMEARGRDGIAVDGLHLVVFENDVELQQIELAVFYAVTPEGPILPEPRIDAIVPSTTTQIALRALDARAFP